jgi:hypothetical protein
MTEPGNSKRRWINLGEIVAVGALAISALGLWNSWRGDRQPAATEVVEKHVAVPLTLRGVPKQDGRSLLVEPVEAGHALDSAQVALSGLKGAPEFELAGDAELDADDIERAMDKADFGKSEKPGSGLHRLPLSIDARYIEAGQTRRSKARYALTYRWEESGLFGGRSLRLAGLSLVSR